MPQLDKLSFATQYFWLSLFFFILYFVLINFFVIILFKNLKLRKIIYRIWYSFVYSFDYSSYKFRVDGLNKIFFDNYYNIYLNTYFLYLKLTNTLIKKMNLKNNQIQGFKNLILIKNLNLNEI